MDIERGSVERKKMKKLAKTEAINWNFVRYAVPIECERREEKKVQYKHSRCAISFHALRIYLNQIEPPTHTHTQPNDHFYHAKFYATKSFFLSAVCVFVFLGHAFRLFQNDHIIFVFTIQMNTKRVILLLKCLQTYKHTERHFIRSIGNNSSNMKRV